MSYLHLFKRCYNYVVSALIKLLLTAPIEISSLIPLQSKHLTCKSHHAVSKLPFVSQTCERAIFSTTTLIG